MTIEEAYSLLSVPRSSSNDEVKRSYRKLMKMYHPDICDDKEFAERQSKIINEAYSLIGKTRFGNNASDDNPEYKDWIFQYTVSDPWKDLKTTPVNNQGYFTRHFGETGYRNIWKPNLESYDHFKSSFYQDIKITVQKISNSYGAYFDDLIIRVLMEYAAMEYVSYIDALETPQRIAEGYLSGSCLGEITFWSNQLFPLGQSVNFQEIKAQNTGCTILITLSNGFVLAKIGNYQASFIKLMLRFGIDICGKIVNVSNMEDTYSKTFLESHNVRYSYQVKPFIETHKSEEKGLLLNEVRYIDNTDIISDILRKYELFLQRGERALSKKTILFSPSDFEVVTKTQFDVGYSIELDFYISRTDGTLINGIRTSVHYNNWLDINDDTHQLICALIRIVSDYKVINIFSKDKKSYYKLIGQNAVVGLRKNKSFNHVTIRII